MRSKVASFSGVTEAAAARASGEFVLRGPRFGFPIEGVFDVGLEPKTKGLLGPLW